MNRINSKLNPAKKRINQPEDKSEENTQLKKTEWSKNNT